MTRFPGRSSRGLLLLDLLRLYSPGDRQLMQALLERARVHVLLEAARLPVQGGLQPPRHLGKLLQPLLRRILAPLLEQMHDLQDHPLALGHIRIGLPHLPGARRTLRRGALRSGHGLAGSLVLRVELSRSRRGASPVRRDVQIRSCRGRSFAHDAGHDVANDGGHVGDQLWADHGSRDVPLPIELRRQHAGHGRLWNHPLTSLCVLHLDELAGNLASVDDRHASANDAAIVSRPRRDEAGSHPALWMETHVRRLWALTHVLLHLPQESTQVPTSPRGN
mmetsp:Transcript_1639/g.7168  ORF Transcript_1639/g.7168 Transcript_1639/m.7168 type:complete len:278 (-) Transcript_1639:276-1109(-)